MLSSSITKFCFQRFRCCLCWVAQRARWRACWVRSQRERKGGGYGGGELGGLVEAALVELLGGVLVMGQQESDEVVADRIGGVGGASRERDFH